MKVFGEGTVPDGTWRRWFEKFETDNFDLRDNSYSGQPSLIDDDVGEQDPLLATSMTSERLNSAQQITSNHIRKIGLVICILFDSKNEQNFPIDLTHLHRRNASKHVRLSNCIVFVSKTKTTN